MDKLKSALADKILEISSSGVYDMKERLDKINRFRDFTNACQALIEKYPAIEGELIHMVNNNDFDTKAASIRVDTVIRLTENTSNTPQQNAEIENDRTKLGSISESLPLEDLPEESFEDIGYKEMPESVPDQYIDFEEINDSTEGGIPVFLAENTPEMDNESGNSVYREPVIDNATIKPRANQAKDNAKKGMQVVIVVAIIVAVIFAIVFVIQNLETVLWGLGVVIILALIVWIILFSRKKKNAEDEEE